RESILLRRRVWFSGPVVAAASRFGRFSSDGKKMGPAQHTRTGPPSLRDARELRRTGKRGKPRPRMGLMRDSRIIDAERCLQRPFRKIGEVSAAYRAAEKCLSGRFGSLLGDLALQLARLGRELVFTGLRQPVVEAADVLDRPQAVRRDAQLHALPERIRD